MACFFIDTSGKQNEKPGDGKYQTPEMENEENASVGFRLGHSKIISFEAKMTAKSADFRVRVE
jgi:hypothetical protein